MFSHLYQQACFLKSVAHIAQLPPDNGREVAFFGRSNAGKSSALNCLTGNKQLAKTSKTPGRTQMINFFQLDESRRLVDLPGYGYAKVPQQIQQQWQKTVNLYLENRQCLCGIVLLVDCRHDLKDMDKQVINWSLARELEMHILLTKADKLSPSIIKQKLAKISLNYPQLLSPLISIQAFSALKKTGLSQLLNRMNQWFLDAHQIK